MNSRKGISIALLLALLSTAVTAGCEPFLPFAETSSDAQEIGRVTVAGRWGGSDIESFEEVVFGWERETGGSMQFEGTSDLDTVLRSRVAGGDPPDIAILPGPALMREFAQSGDIVPIDDILQGALAQRFSETWLDLSSVQGRQFGLCVKATPKSTVWYSPRSFASNGWGTPATWEELIALSDAMAKDGTPPWSIGVESGGESGWPASDWIQEILLAESGPEVYDQWVNHEISWTDKPVRSAFSRFGRIVHHKGWVAGGAGLVTSTAFQDAAYAPFRKKPKAQMHFLGHFAQGFLEAEYPDKKPGTDFDFFDFPSIDKQYPGAATGSVDILVVFNDNPSTRSLLQYLADGEHWEVWASEGGFTTPNMSLDPAAYADDLTRKAATQLTESQAFRVDADDLMPPEVQSAYWAGLIEYIDHPESLDRILKQIERVAQAAYAARAIPEPLETSPAE